MDEPPLIIIQEETDSECRLCEHEETTDHLTSGNHIFAKNEHLKMTKQNCYTSALFNMQSTWHWKDRKMARARMHTDVLANRRAHARARTHAHTQSQYVNTICNSIKADLHLACRAAKGLECLSHVIYTVRPCLIHTCHSMPVPCSDHAVLQGHGTARPSRDGLWATCPRSASSGYHAEFHEDCYQKHTSPPHNDPYLRLWRVVAAHHKKRRYVKLLD
jgi:hypothetical protein